MNILNKKKKRDEKQITITIGKSPKGYYYISDSLNESSKIKIPISGLSKEDNQSISRDNNQHDIYNNTSPQQIIPEEIPQLAKTNEQNKTQPFYLPICSSWFNFDSINEIESKALPEFFCGKYPSKTPEIYKEYRNYLINLFRENPNAYLTATTCRKNLSGDAGSIIRLHAFLEHWGLINFNVDPEMKSTHPFLSKTFNFKAPIYIDASALNKKIGVNQENTSDQSLNTPGTGITVTAPTQSQNSNQVMEVNQSKPSPKEQIKGLFPLNEHSETLYKDLLNQHPVSTLNQINFFDYNSRPRCDMCHNPCDIHWYINSKEEELKANKQNDKENSKVNELKIVILCDSCYDKDEYPEGTQKKDYDISNVFNLMMQNQKNNRTKLKIEKEKWSDEESKQLIEAINNYGDNNWDDIIKVFNEKRTKADCIIHLMQLGPLLNQIKNKNTIEIKKEEETKEIGIEIKEQEEKSKPKLVQLQEQEQLQDQEQNEKEEEVNHNTQTSELNHVILFAKMFEKYVSNSNNSNQINADDNLHNSSNKDSNGNKDLSSSEYMKEIMYKTYAKSINVSHNLKQEEKEEIKRIMNLLIYFQMKKLELKLNYITEFEKMIQYETMQLKTVESQIMQDRIKLSMKKNDLIRFGMKIRNAQRALREEYTNKVSSDSKENIEGNAESNNVINQETTNTIMIYNNADSHVQATEENINAIAIENSNNNINIMKSNTNLDIKPTDFNKSNDIPVPIINTITNNNEEMNIVPICNDALINTISKTENDDLPFDNNNNMEIKEDKEKEKEKEDLE